MISSKKIEIRECSFLLEVTEAFANVRFPCTFFFELKTANGKHHVASSNRVKANNGTIPFQETVTLNVLMAYDLKQEKYKKKEATILVSLLSNSRPNDPKLVGRVTLDLSEVSNLTYPQSLTNHSLEYCSVKGSITFKIAMISHRTTTMEIAELDRSDLIEGEIFSSSNLKASKEEHLPQSSSVRSYGRDTARLGESSLQQRLARIKAEKMDLGSRAEPLMKWKKQQEQQKHDKQLPQNLENGGSGIKNLSSDLSLPVLSKNCSDIQSIKNSQGTMKNEISENIVKISEIRAKDQIKIKTDKYIEHADNCQAIDKGLSCREIQDRKVKDQVKQPKNKYTSNLGDQESRQLRIKLQQSINRQTNLSQLLKERQQEIEKLNHSCQEYTIRISTLQKKCEILEQSKHSYQQTVKQNQNIKHLMTDLQTTLSNLQIEHQQILDISAGKDRKISQLQKELQRVVSVEQIPNNQRQQEIQELKHQFQTEQKNHQNTQIQLEEIREWFGQLQEKYETLQIKATELAQQRDNLQKKWQESLENQRQPKQRQHENQNQNEQIFFLKNILQQKEKQIMMLMQELTHLSEQLAHKQNDKQEVEKQLDIAKKELSLSHVIEKELKDRLELVTQESDEKELRLLEKDEDLQQEKEKINRLQGFIKEKEQKVNAQIKEAGLAADTKRRLQDLVVRMRQKEQAIAKLQRQAERYKQSQRQYQFQISRYKQKIKQGQKQRLQTIDKQKSIENQIKLLTRKLQRQSALNIQEIAKYKVIIQQEAAKRRELQRQIVQQETRNEESNRKIVSELEGKIALHLDKEETLRENLNIVENEVNRIGDLLQQKEEREEYYTQVIVSFKQKNEQMTIKINDYQNQLSYMRERCEALEGEVELLNAYATEEQDHNQLMQINKKVTEQNKALLKQLQDKNKIIGNLEKNIGENKVNSSHQQLSNSRFLHEKKELQEKIVYLSDENEKLYKEFQRLNLKFEEQLQINERINSDRVTQLAREIEQLSINLLDKEDKQKSLISELRQAREKQQNIENALMTIQSEKGRYIDQIRELIQEKESLKTKLVVLNQQYESIYSQIGQKEYQLYETTGKLKDLQEKIAKENSKQALKPNQDQIQAEKNSKLQQYVFEIQVLKMKLKERDQQSQTLKNNLHSLQAGSNIQISKLQGIKQHLQSQYQAQIDNLNSKVHEFETICLEKDQDYQNILRKAEMLQIKINELLLKKQDNQNQISSLQKQRNTLKDQIEYLSSKQIQNTTPIHQFQESPLSSVCRIQKIDLNYTLEEITNIIVRRKDQQQIQGVLRLVIENNSRYEEDTERWSRERGAIQQKAKMASRQIQKMKSQIMKTPNRSISQKAHMTGMLRPVQKIIVELINMSQSLSEWQLQHEGYEERQKENVQIQ